MTNHRHLLLATLAGMLAVWSARAQTPVDPENRFNIGLTHLREGRASMALEEFKQAIKQEPKNPYFYKGLGLAYSRLADQCPARDESCRQGHLKDAIAAARKALELNPYYVDVRNDLGTALVRAGKREDGKKELMTSFNDPQNPTPEFSAHNLGLAYFEEKNYAEALNWFRTSQQRSKSYPQAYVGVADALVALGRLDEAIAQLEAGLNQTSDDVTVVLALGEVYYRAGRFNEARTRLEQATKKDPVGPAGRRASELLKKFPK